ncbi:MAG: HDIG domain-containing protein [bacterium]
MRAPGSYHHSMMVGSLCEAAAEAVGGNPLLARVGAYYHDIGKAKNPQYFAENQKPGINPHDKLKPNMSALIIKAHVKDGLEMARHYRLPEVIQVFIAQHHGTSLIAYFYHRAKQLEDPEIHGVDEKDYRYPGPKPQSRETAICLLADGIEAASRAMPEPTPAKLKGLVQKMINKAFTDGQLDECELTLKDLNLIAQAFNRILAGIYHHRPEYPGDKKREAVASAPDPPDRKKNGKRAKDKEQDFDGNTDVWELTAERNQLEVESHASGHSVGGNGAKASEGSPAAKSDSETGRESLPRLGSS